MALVHYNKRPNVDDDEDESAHYPYITIGDEMRLTSEHEKYCLVPTGTVIGASRKIHAPCGKFTV